MYAHVQHVLAFDEEIRDIEFLREARAAHNAHSLTVEANDREGFDAEGAQVHACALLELSDRLGAQREAGAVVARRIVVGNIRGVDGERELHVLVGRGAVFTEIAVFAATGKNPVRGNGDVIPGRVVEVHRRS